MMPPLVLGAQAGEDILDMCAAPGVKTTQIAAPPSPRSQAHLTACEIAGIPRAEKLESSLHRPGFQNVPVMRIDARRLDEFFRFDRILLDAPCTGTGTVISGNEKSLRGLTEQLLRASAPRSQASTSGSRHKILKPSGHARLFGLCSVLPQENEGCPARGPSTKATWTGELAPLDGTPEEAKHAAPAKPVRNRASRCNAPCRGHCRGLRLGHCQRGARHARDHSA